MNHTFYIHAALFMTISILSLNVAWALIQGWKIYFNAVQS